MTSPAIDIFSLMTTQFLRDRAEIEGFLRRDVFLNIYGLGDLDDAWWPATAWHGVRGQDGLIQTLALLFSGLSQPTLLALSTDALPELRGLLERLSPLLPAKFYAHLSPGLDTALKGHQLSPHGMHDKMALTRPERLSGPDAREAFPLTMADAQEARRFYDESYPGHWFEPASLRAGRYFGMRRQGRLVAAAGTHVFSPRYRVAALGNIAVRPEFRGHGLGQAVTAALCRSLLDEVDHIGLNVKSDNAAARACYQALGFTTHACYEEFSAS